MNIPEDLRYTKEHEWIRVEGNVGIVGITDYAQSELGDIVYVDIDPALESVKQGEAFGTIEAVKTVADLYAPVSGKVLEIHEDINDEPEKINQDPYGEGWLIKIEISDPGELENLLTAEQYAELISET